MSVTHECAQWFILARRQCVADGLFAMGLCVVSVDQQWLCQRWARRSNDQSAISSASRGTNTQRRTRSPERCTLKNRTKASTESSFLGGQALHYSRFDAPRAHFARDFQCGVVCTSGTIFISTKHACACLSLCARCLSTLNSIVDALGRGTIGIVTARDDRPLSSNETAVNAFAASRSGARTSETWRVARFDSKDHSLERPSTRLIARTKVVIISGLVS